MPLEVVREEPPRKSPLPITSVVLTSARFQDRRITVNAWMKDCGVPDEEFAFASTFEGSLRAVCSRQELHDFADALHELADQP